MSDFSDTLKDNLLIKLNRILHCHDDVTCMKIAMLQQK